MIFIVPRARNENIFAYSEYFFAQICLVVGVAQRAEYFFIVSKRRYSREKQLYVTLCERLYPVGHVRKVIIEQRLEKQILVLVISVKCSAGDIGFLKDIPYRNVFEVVFLQKVDK